MDLMNMDAWVKIFIYCFSEKMHKLDIWAILKNVYEWKLHHWSPQEPRNRCTKNYEKSLQLCENSKTMITLVLTDT